METKTKFFEPSKILTNLQEKLNDEPVYSEIENLIDFNNKKNFITSLVDNTSLNRKDNLYKLLNRKLSQKSIAEDDEKAYSIAAESIILLHGRPVLSVMNDLFEEPESDEWKKRLGNLRNSFANISKAVGRIELVNHPSFSWVGTGWMYGDNFLITNRHVANEFVYKKQDGQLSFKSFDTAVKSYVDFKEENLSPTSFEFKIAEVVYVSEEYEADIAIFKVKRINENDENLPAERLQLYGNNFNYNDENNYVGAIGYPAYDSRIPDANLMNTIFKGIYNKKRFSPGKITSFNDNQYLHDCTTSGGNSGSPIIETNTGKVVGLHFGGSFRKSNYSVSSNHLREIFNKVGI